MTPKQYYELRQHHEHVKRAKYLVKHCRTNRVVDLTKIIAFKQETGMLPEDYIERYEDAWKK